jgi:hypothetical protein
MLIVAQAGGSEAIDSALIAAVVALVVALFTHLSVIVRDGNARRYERRRAALLDAQDAALILRQRVHEYGSMSRENSGRPSPELSDAERNFDDARSALDVALSRVEDARVGALIKDWQVLAQIRFVSAQDVSVSQEQISWDRMNDAIGQALTSKTGSSPG